MSGAPFTIYDSSIDADRNGELVDPVPAGTYSGPVDPDAMQNVRYAGGRNGAIGPDYFQLDLRAGWRRKIRSNKALEVFLDIFNVTNRANFDNPTTTNSDMRHPLVVPRAHESARRRRVPASGGDGVQVRFLRF